MHAIDMSNNRANMAYVGEKPWHGLGEKLEAGASREQWRKAAGLDWSIQKAAILMQKPEGEAVDVTSALNRNILYRDDTGAPLSVMSANGYHIHQPREIFDFIADSAEAMGWPMDTAGSLQGGRKIWALANIGQDFELPGGDKVSGYLLAATSCDGTMGSTFMIESVRVVCQNTLHAAVRDSSGQPKVVVYHGSKLDAQAVKEGLGLVDTVWAGFIEQAKDLTRISMSDSKARSLLRRCFPTPAPLEPRLVAGERISDEEFVAASRGASKVLEFFQGAGIGSDLLSAKGTAWGLVNATTQYLDHVRGRSNDTRLHSAWFGSGALLKQQVVDACFEAA
jgi:phage/plasmid-like protein (TIGR03299 family)